MTRVNQRALQTDLEPAASTVGAHQPQPRWLAENRDICGAAVGDEVRGPVPVATVLCSLVVINLGFLNLPYNSSYNYPTPQFFSRILDRPHRGGVSGKS